MNPIRSSAEESGGEGNYIIAIGSDQHQVADGPQASIAEDGGHVRSFGTQLYCRWIASTCHLLAEERTTHARGQLYISFILIRRQ